MIIFILLVAAVIFQRLYELRISKRNTALLISEGGIELGAKHYKYIVMLHVLFILSMIAEYAYRSTTGNLNQISYLFLVLFVVLQAARFWVLNTLGKYWSTRIVRVPGTALIVSGPYRFVRHPNYIIVALEIFCIPMIFGLIYTAVAFTLLNAAMLAVRIREENRAIKNTLP